MIQGYDIVVYLCDYNSLIEFVTIQRRFCRFPNYGEHIGKSVTVCDQKTLVLQCIYLWLACHHHHTASPWLDIIPIVPRL